VGYAVTYLKSINIKPMYGIILMIIFAADPAPHCIHFLILYIIQIPARSPGGVSNGIIIL